MQKTPLHGTSLDLKVLNRIPAETCSAQLCNVSKPVCTLDRLARLPFTL